jgi:hypothetical protein
VKKYRYSERKYRAAVKEIAKQVVAWAQKHRPTLEDIDVASVADDTIKYDTRLDIYEEIVTLTGPRAKAKKKR